MEHQAGHEMYELAKRLFPICRSLTGNGVRQSFYILQEVFPDLKVCEVPSGTAVFDWTIPKEWNIRDAFIKDENGNVIVDFKKNNLHVLGYSSPINKTMSLGELQENLYSLPEQPDVIPYVTSYYKERWGFCLTDNQRRSLKDGKYHVVIDSELKVGSLTYGEIIIPATKHKNSAQEIFLSTNICHPSLANNELSGPCVAIHLAKWLSEQESRRYTYRIVFVPETIGSLTYLSKNLDALKKNVVAGYTLTCVGDDRAYSYQASASGDTLADRVAKNILSFHAPDFKSYSFLERGSDERQYCSPKINLPLCTIMRSKLGEYPEYHTSADDLSVISPAGLQGAFDVHTQCFLALENNFVYQSECFGEPQLGKRGLYPTISYKGSADDTRAQSNFLAYADGKNDLIEISNKICVPVSKLVTIANKLLEHGLVSVV